MKKVLLALSLMVMVGLQAIMAQTTNITGTVTDAGDGFPIPGVSVFVKGTTVGTVTQPDGKYTLAVPNDATTLVFSFVGMSTQEVEIGGQTTINVSLQSDAVDVDEVIVVAYGTAKKSSFTGSVGGVSERQMSKLQTSDPAKALAGNVSGVRIVSQSGRPDGDTKIRIRGIGSINASSDPLIIVDGAPYDGNLNSINTHDIKSMNVLKDAASSALYGARGANGVIVITTKSGEKGSQIKFDAKIGMNYRGVPEYEIMESAGEYYETYWDAVRNYHQYDVGLTPEAAAAAASSAGDDGLYTLLGYNIYNVPNDQIVGTDGKLNPNAKVKYADAGDFNDWGKHLYDPAMRQEYNLSMSKMIDKSKLYFSVGYLEDKGYTPNSQFQRLSSKLSFDTDVTDWFTLKVSNLFSNTNSDRVADNTSSYTNSFAWMRNIAPIYPVYRHDAAGAIVLDTNGNKVYDFGEAEEGVNLARGYGAVTNPVATQNLDVEERNSYYLTNNFVADLSITKDLKFSTTATIYNNWYEYDDFTTPTAGAGKAYNGIGSKYRTRTSTLNWNQILRYSKEINGFGLNVMLGHESYSKDIVSLNGEKRNFLDPKNIEFSNAAQMTELDSYKRGYNLEGYFSQVTVDYSDKYYLSGSYRRDGSSIFHPDNRWGDFYSIGASWRIKQESFLKDVSFIDNLKLKASYGTQGNDFIWLPNSTTRRAYTPYKSLIEITSDGTNFGTQKLYLGNKDVTWEKNNNFNVGMEFTLFNGLLSGEAEYFHKETNDLLFNLPVPQSTGYQSTPTNIGDMKNTGFEVLLNSKIINRSDLRWDFSLNLTHFKNEVTKLPDQFKEEGITRGNQIVKVGGSVYDFWMVEYVGVDESNGDALFNMYNKETEQFEVTNNPNGSDYDLVKSKKLVGNSIPDLAGGFNTFVEYKNFDFSAQFAFQLGGKVNDGVYGRLMHEGGQGDNWHTDIRNRWTPTNTKTDVPRVEYNNRDLTYNSDRFITDATHLAFNNLTIGYTFPKSLLDRINISSVRVYFVADNIALWSKRKGLDPRMEFSGDIRTSRYAPIRTASFGLVVNL